MVDSGAIQSEKQIFADCLGWDRGVSTHAVPSQTTRTESVLHAPLVYPPVSESCSHKECNAKLRSRPSNSLTNQDAIELVGTAGTEKGRMGCFGWSNRPKKVLLACARAALADGLSAIQTAQLGIQNTNKQKNTKESVSFPWHPGARSFCSQRLLQPQQTLARTPSRKSLLFNAFIKLLLPQYLSSTRSAGAKFYVAGAPGKQL